MLVSMEMVENVLDVNGLDLITIMVMFWVERLFFCLLVGEVSLCNDIC